MVSFDRSPLALSLLLALPLACSTDDGADDSSSFGDEIDTSEGDEQDTTTGESGESSSDTTDDESESSDTATETDSTETDSTETDSTETDSTETDSTETDSTETDSTEESTSESTTTDSGGNCTQCGVTLDSTQSSSFVALPGTQFLGYATLQGDKIIYALDEVGTGRVIYTADTNILYKEITDCPLWEWLGQTGMSMPKVLSFGRYLCDGLGNNLGAYPDLTYAGDHLPAQYVGNPALLAQEYDAVIYCTLAATTAAESQTIVDYVMDHGGGLYLASEYWGFINQGDLNAVNAIGMPFGVQFEATNLDWGQANGEIDFECFPDPQ